MECQDSTPGISFYRGPQLNQNNYVVASATGDEIMPIVERVGAAINGTPISQATMALLFVVFVMSYPKISNEDLAEGIKDSSAHICMLLDGYENKVPSGIDKNKVN